MRGPISNRLPLPSRGKTGWPWDEETQEAPDAMPNGSSWPRITIVTPSYNQGEFIEGTIRSVLLQNYPNLEYIIIDGGSTDNTVEVIRKYEQWLHYWVSEEDQGQSDAINKGLEKATGGIFNWLNSDDFLEAGALFQVAEAYGRNPDASGWAGGCRLLWGSGRERTVVFPNGLEREHLGNNWNGGSVFQPACFLSSENVRAVGGLDSTLHFCLDLELYLRLLERGKFVIGKGLWANAIIHPQAKTQKLRERSYMEVIELQKKLGFLEGAKNRYDRMFAKGRLAYVMPPGLCDIWVKSRKPYMDNTDLCRQPFSFYRRNHICFVGDFSESYILDAVQYFIDEIFPLITDRHPKTNLHIFGKNCDTCNHLRKHKNVKVMGEVQDLKTTLRNYKLFVYPLLSNAGVSNEFGKAAGIGLPIVSSATGSKGYPVKDGDHCFIAEDSWEFAQKCNHCLEDPPTWGNFSVQSQIMMSQHLSQEVAASNGGGAKTGVQKQGNIVVVQGGFPALSATFILDQMTGLIKRGYEVETWATYDPQERLTHPEIERYELLEKTRYIKIPHTLFRIYPKIWVKRFLHINNIKNFNKVDAFHVNYGTNFNLIKPIFQYYNTFVLVSFHGHDASRYIQHKSASCYDDLFARANLITSPSYYMRSILSQKGCPSEKMKVHRYGLDLSFFQPKPTNNKKERIILLTVARLVEKKGIEYSLKAMSKIMEKYKLRFRIVGDGPLKSDLEKLTRRLGLENQVEFLGALDKEGVVQQMSEADIFVLTSITAGDGDQEGLPVSLIEAQAMGLPVVSSYHTGIPELIVDGQTGLLAKEKDTEKIAEHLGTLVRNHELRLTFGQNARERVKKEFDLAALNDELADYFSSGIKSIKAG